MHKIIQLESLQWEQSLFLTVPYFLIIFHMIVLEWLISCPDLVLLCKTFVNLVLERDKLYSLFHRSSSKRKGASQNIHVPLTLREQNWVLMLIWLWFVAVMIDQEPERSHIFPLISLHARRRLSGFLRKQIKVCESVANTKTSCNIQSIKIVTLKVMKKIIIPQGSIKLVLNKSYGRGGLILLLISQIFCNLCFHYFFPVTRFPSCFRT